MTPLRTHRVGPAAVVLLMITCTMIAFGAERVVLLEEMTNNT